MILLKYNGNESTVLADGSALDILTELTFCVGKLYARLASGAPPEFAKYFKTVLQHSFSDESPVWDVGLKDATGCCIVTDKAALRRALEEEERADQ